KDILTKLGHEVIGEAENGLDALEQYKKLEPEIITMDITMPEMDGIAAVKEIRKINQDVKIIMCSWKGQQGMDVVPIQVGAKDFIVKTRTPEWIKEALEKIV